MTNELKSVPSILLPLAEKEINAEWAVRNYKHLCVFNCNVSFAEYTAEDIAAWVNEAKVLCNELREYGTAKAEEHIVWLCKHHYADQIKNVVGNKFKLQNMYDVVHLMGNNKFYEKKTDLFMDLLHMFQYGIFRCAFNAWAVDAATEWMAHRNIIYETNRDMILSGKGYGRRGKGFVYRLLVSRASNTLCVRFQKLTRRVFKEYIIFRDRKFSCIENVSTVECYTFNKHYNGYIVKLNPLRTDFLNPIYWV